ncbi:MAG TPA: hypothetical protein VG013_27725, partial [Gemmataceae bacterium]|nr:hypothetical protein [Gemmataceae bacterium]
MPWPLSQDYNEAIQDPRSAFSDPELRQGEAATNTLGLPMPRSGNFADVYEFRSPSRKWAVKCFTREVPGLRDRYREVSAYLRRLNLPFMVDFRYLDEGIRVRGQWYPVLKMHWVEGLTLNEFVRDAVARPQALEMLAHIWVRLSRRLREANLAHCDLQHGNVLLVPGSKASALAVKLIDYDGMFVPALARRQSGELGHPAFQHPQRLREGTYSLEVDRFPHLVIFCALRGLIAGGRPLWDRYDNGDNLLFRQKDLAAPPDSALFADLRKLDDPALRRVVETLSFCASRPLEKTALLEHLVPIEEATRARSRTGTVAALTPEMIFAATTAIDGPEPPRRRRQKKHQRWPWFAAASVLVLVAAGAIGVTVLSPKSDEPVPHQPTVAANDVQPSPPPEGVRAVPHQEVRPPADPPREQGWPEPKPPDKPGPAPASDKPAPAPVLPSNLLPVHTKTAWIGGVAGKGGAGPFEDSLPNGLLVGFEVHPAKDADGKQFIAGIAPVYATTPADGHEPVHGKTDGPRSRIVGGAGDAVAGIVAQGEGKIYGFQVIFMRSQGLQLDRRARSESPWVGGHGGKEVILGGDGSPVVGIYGNGSDALERVGLIRIAGKFALPDPGGQAKAEAWVDNVFKEDLARSDPDGLRAGAAKLLRHARAVSDPTTRFVLLERTRDLATRAGDFAQAFTAVDELAQEYDVSNALQMKADALEKAVPSLERQEASAGARPDYAGLLRVAPRLIDRAVATHDFQAARSLLLFARKTAQKAHDQAAETDAGNRLAEVAIIAKGGRLTPPDPSPPPVVVQRLPVPGAREQAKAEAEVKELFEDDYAKRKPADRVALAGKLLKQGASTKEKPAVSYVLLREAQDVAAEAGDAEGALEAIGLLGRRYAVDAPALKKAALDRAARAARTPAAVHALVGSYVALIGESIDADSYETALDLLTAAQAVAHKANNPSFTAWLRSRKETLTQLQKEFQQLKPARATLRKNPGDPAANTAVGRFDCLVKGDWGKGLPRLSAGDDPELKALAARDLANASTPAEQADVADAYYERARAEEGTARVHVYRRAYHWYQRAAPRLEGLTQARVEKRMKELEHRPGLWLPEVVGCSRRFEGHTGAVLSVAVAPDGRTALSGGKDRTARLWDVATGEEVRRYADNQTAVRCVGFQPDGRRALRGTVDGTVRVWDLKSNQPLMSYPGFGDTDVNAVFLPGERGFLAAGRRFLRLWPEHGNSQVNHEFKPNVVTSLAVSGDGLRAVVGTVSGSARLWDIQNEQEGLTLVGRKAEILGIAMTGDGRYAATASADKTVSLWDLKTGHELHHLKGHGGPVRSVAFSPDGRRVLSGSEDGSVRLWDVKTGKLLLRLDGHRGPVHSVVFTPDGRHALSGGEDQTLRWWVVVSGPALSPRGGETPQ